ncbi:SRPBCC domain-containing protein [Streptosporangium sp. NPDC020072]|uniref:SRPBCC family protein n=1 Tax=Streptosporangium sp. NPDC020072 TaxID=3154788 RepID=UPI00341E48AB
MGHEFEVRRQVELAADPEEVWQAIATGPGVDSWFMGRSRIEPRQGGSTRLTVGGAVEEATITSWEPPGRFAYRTGRGEDGTFMAFEWLVEGRDRGSTVLRLVHEGFLEGDWESEYEAMQSGWDMYLHTLAAYLRHFPGLRGTPVSALKVGAAGPERAWAALTGALGLPATAAVGEPVSVAPEGLAPIEGVLDYADPFSCLGVRTGDALYRFLHSGERRGDAVFLAHHVYSGGAGEQELGRAWQAWLERLFPPRP